MSYPQTAHGLPHAGARVIGTTIRLTPHIPALVPSATVYDASLLSSALLFGMLHNLPSAPTIVAGSCAMAASVGIAMLMVARRWVFPSALRPLALLWLALVLTYTLRLTPGLLANGLKTLFQLLTVVALVMSASSVRWDVRALTTFSRCGIIASAWCAVAYLLDRYHWGPFAEVSANIVGIWGFLALGVCMLSFHLFRTSVWRLLSLAGAALAVVVIFRSASRSAIAGALLYVLFYILWPFVSRRRWLTHLSFAMIVAQLLFVPWLFTYGGLTATRFRELQFFMWEMFEKNLNTRAHVWGHSLNVLMESPWIGHGTGFWPFREEVAIRLSCHNTFLNIAVQTGLLGAGIFVLILWFAWGLYARSQSQAELRPFAAFLAGLIILRSFETGMTENDLATGYFEWIIVSLGVSCAVYGVLRSANQCLPTKGRKPASPRKRTELSTNRSERS